MKDILSALLLGLSLAGVGVSLFLRGEKQKRLRDASRLAVPVLLIVLVQVWNRPFVFQTRAGVLDWFVMGLFFWLVGEVLDVFWQKGTLRAVLLSLMYAVYVIGFKRWPLREPGFLLPALVLGALVLLVWLAAFRRVAAAQGGSKPALAVYSLLAAGMVYSALYGFVDWNWKELAASLSSLGALLLAFAEIRLGLDAGNRSTALGLYQLGQVLLAAGAMVHF